MIETERFVLKYWDSGGIVARVRMNDAFENGFVTCGHGLEARGSGAYPALVRARWDAAVRLGTPALVTHALPMSKPILDRLGIRTLCELQFLTGSC